MTTRSLAAFLAVALAGCAGDFDPPSLLTDARILAIVAEPIETTAADTVVATAHVYLPDGDAVAGSSWSFCPYSLGPTAGYACIDERCEFDIGGDSQTVSFSAGALAAGCLEAVGSEGGPGQGGEPPDYVSTFLRFDLQTEAGTTRSAMLEQRLWLAAAPPQNRHPAISSVLVGGREASAGEIVATAKAGEVLPVEVLVDASSLDEYEDEAGRKKREAAVVSFYADAGSFQYDRLEGTEVTSEWTAGKLPDGSGQVRLFVVVRDLRGGQAPAGPFLVQIE